MKVCVIYEVDPVMYARSIPDAINETIAICRDYKAVAKFLTRYNHEVYNADGTIHLKSHNQIIEHLLFSINKLVQVNRYDTTKTLMVALEEVYE